jgi:hypothetical protein
VAPNPGHPPADGVGHRLNFPLVVFGWEVEVDLRREHDRPRLDGAEGSLDVSAERPVRADLGV